MTRPLGKIQTGVLNALRRNGRYYPGCGWYWDSHKTTVRYLDQLVKRGLATAELHTYKHHLTKQIVTMTLYKPVNN